jgi:glycosidase
MRRSLPGRLAAVVAVASLAAAACTGGSSPPGGSPSVSASASGSTGDANSPATTGVRFSTDGGDVWAWSQDLTGTGDCAQVQIVVDGTAVDADVSMTGGGFEATVPVAPGDQQVVARCTDAGGATTDSEPITLTGRLTPGPTARIDVSVRGDSIVLDGGHSDAAQPDGAAVRAYAWSAGSGLDADPEPLRLTDGKPLDGASDARVKVRAPSADGEYYVWLTVTDAQGREDRAGSYFVVQDGKARTVDLMTEHPSWIDSSVVYAPIAQLWGNNGFATIDAHLKYLADLGVDALWLWPPVTERAPGEEYAITDYFSTDPSWGDPKDLKSLVQDAHRLGMRVLLDLVPNHTSDQHPYFLDAQDKGTGSHYYDFYDRDANGKYTHYFDWTNLPNLNYDNPQVRTMITQAFEYWIKTYDVDGFRVDASWGVKKRRPDFWPEWRTELKRIKPDLMLISESPSVDPYYFRNGFDIAYDWWQRQLGQWAWTNAFDSPDAVAGFIDPALTNSGEGYPTDALILRFLNNNDTDIRFVDRYDAATTKVASAMEFTVTGVPLMFAGDEIGARYLPYSNLTKIPWKDRYGLEPWYRQLISLRDEHPALRSRDMIVLEADTDAVVSYVRPAVGDDGPFLVVLNYGGKTNVTLASDPSLAAFGGALTDVMTGTTVQARASKDGVSVAVDKESVLVLTPGSGA